MNEEHELHWAEKHPTAGDHSIMEHHSMDDHTNTHADPAPADLNPIQVTSPDFLRNRCSFNLSRRS